MRRYFRCAGQKRTTLHETIVKISIIFVFWLLGVETAFAQSCAIDGPRYNLTADTVEWSMKIESGGSCVHGVRFNNVSIESIKLLSPPQIGKVALQDPGFRYSARTDFSGQDAFSLAVSGAIHQISGNSTTNVTVYVIQPGAADPTTTTTTPVRDTIPPSVAFTAPSDGAIVSGSFVTLSATASDNVAVAHVQSIIDGKNIGPAITTPPYATTWNSNEIADGSHTIYAVAQDTSGNYKTSSIRLMVENAVPKPSTRP